MYYAVMATNGFGVFDDYSRVEKACPYLKKMKVRKFGSFTQAFEEAVGYYNECQQQTDYAVDSSFYGMSSDIVINRVMFKREIADHNLEFWR